MRHQRLWCAHAWHSNAVCVQVYKQLELPFALLLGQLGRQPLALDPSALQRELPRARERYIAPVMHQAAAQASRQAQAEAAAVVQSSAWLKLLQWLVRTVSCALCLPRTPKPSSACASSTLRWRSTAKAPSPSSVLVHKCVHMRVLVHNSSSTGCSKCKATAERASMCRHVRRLSKARGPRTSRLCLPSTTQGLSPARRWTGCCAAAGRLLRMAAHWIWCCRPLR